MGTFSEVVLGFSFKPETPDHVLAAFADLAVDSGPDVYGTPPPDLPEPIDVAEADEAHGWEPTDQSGDPARDPLPWRHDWAGWFSRSMSVAITPCAQLVWAETGQWTLSCRWAVKAEPAAIVPALRWLGPYLEAFEDRPILLGYIQSGGAPRPMLIWLTPDGRIEGEDLNPGTEAAAAGAAAGRAETAETGFTRPGR